jgi:hypothetical protein
MKQNFFAFKMRTTIPFEKAIGSVFRKLLDQVSDQNEKVENRNTKKYRSTFLRFFCALLENP